MTMKLINEIEMSKWTYEQCFNNDTPEMRGLITNEKNPCLI